MNAEHKCDSGHNHYWLSISDLISSLTFIFITSLMSFSLIFHKQKEAYENTQRELLKAPNARAALLADIRKDLAANGLKAEIIEKDGVIRFFDETLAFPMAKAYPDLEYRKNLGKIAKILNRNLACYTPAAAPIQPAEDDAGNFEHCAVTVTPPQACNGKSAATIQSVMVEGHTDAVPLKAGVGYFDNLTLSAARASTVFRIMRRCAPELEAFQNSDAKAIFGVAGYSSTRPIYATAPRDPRNRRIDIRIIMEGHDPDKLELKAFLKKPAIPAHGKM